MKYAVGCLAIAAAMVGSPASAVQLTGQSSWAFGLDLIGAVDFSGQRLSEIAPARVDVNLVMPMNDPGGIWVTAPVVDATYGDSLRLSSFQTSGGVTITSERSPLVSLGGSIDVTDLNIDLASKRVYATLRGDFSGATMHQAGQGDPNQVMTVENFHLFDYQSLAGSTTLNPGGTTYFIVSGLSITSSGLDHFISALRMTHYGPQVWSSVTDYGTITTSITLVPEPSTWSLMLLGGVLITAASHKRYRAQQG